MVCNIVEGANVWEYIDPKVEKQPKWLLKPASVYLEIIRANTYYISNLNSNKRE